LPPLLPPPPLAAAASATGAADGSDSHWQPTGAFLQRTLAYGSGGAARRYSLRRAAPPHRRLARSVVGASAGCGCMTAGVHVGAVAALPPFALATPTTFALLYFLPTGATGTRRAYDTHTYLGCTVLVASPPAPGSDASGGDSGSVVQVVECALDLSDGCCRARRGGGRGAPANMLSIVAVVMSGTPADRATRECLAGVQAWSAAHTAGHAAPATSLVDAAAGLWRATAGGGGAAQLAGGSAWLGGRAAVVGRAWDAAITVAATPEEVASVVDGGVGATSVTIALSGTCTVLRSGTCAWGGSIGGAGVARVGRGGRPAAPPPRPPTAAALAARCRGPFYFSQEALMTMIHAMAALRSAATTSALLAQLRRFQRDRLADASAACPLCGRTAPAATTATLRAHLLYQHGLVLHPTAIPPSAPIPTGMHVVAAVDEYVGDVVAQASVALPPGAVTDAGEWNLAGSLPPASTATSTILSWLTSAPGIQFAPAFTAAPDRKPRFTAVWARVEDPLLPPPLRYRIARPQPAPLVSLPAAPRRAAPAPSGGGGGSGGGKGKALTAGPAASPTRSTTTGAGSASSGSHRATTKRGSGGSSGGGGGGAGRAAGGGKSVTTTGEAASVAVPPKGRPRQYFHPQTGQPVAEDEVDVDSDDDVDETWILEESNHLIDSFGDLATDDASLMKMWNEHVFLHPLYADNQVPDSASRFAATYGARIRGAGLRAAFLRHLCLLWDYALLDFATIAACMRTVDTAPAPAPAADHPAAAAAAAAASGGSSSGKDDAGGTH